MVETEDLPPRQALEARPACVLILWFLTQISGMGWVVVFVFLVARNEEPVKSESDG